MDEDRQVTGGVAFLQTTENRLHVSVVVRIDLEASVSTTIPLYNAAAYNREDNVSLRSKVLEELKILDSANSGLQAERLELLCLLLRAGKGSDLKRLGRGVGEQASENRSADIA